MNRRQYLRSAAVCGAGAVAGCLGVPTADSGLGSDPDPGAGTGRSGGSLAGRPAGPGPPGVEADLDLPVDRSELTRGADRDAIPAIVDPAFAPDWDDLDRNLAPTDLVIGVARETAGSADGGRSKPRARARARAYPLVVLRSHEVVNDDLEGPLLVTYCPLCATAVVAVRTVDGRPTTFGVSGLLYNADLVMYDEATDSLWSQVLARAIRGPATGQRLELVASTLTTWRAWREEYPDTEVLLPPPASETVPEPYDPGTDVGYEGRGLVGIGGPRRELGDDRLPATARVIGVARGDEARAYPREAVVAAGVVNDWVGDLPVVVAAGPTLHAYDRRVDGDVLTFERAGDRRLRGGDSEWSIPTGRAVSGPHEGRRLRRASGPSAMYWFAWAEFRPDTEVYRP